MIEILVGIFATIFIAWSGWVSISVIQILRKTDIILYEMRDQRTNNEKSGVSL